jgi:transcriptional regulator with XRE-family HTH domain
LAEKADISIPFLSNTERSNKWPHPDTLVKLAQALDVEVYMLFQENTPLPAHIEDTLAQYKRDMTVSLHKMVSSAIDCSLETIGAHYLNADPGNK